MPRDKRPGSQPEDLGQVYDRLGPSLYRYARVILDDAAEAEDAIHDVFVDLIKSGETLPQVLDGYLFTSVRNVCMTILRRRGRHGTDSAGFLEPVRGGQDAVNQRLALEGAIRSLPLAQREVVHLKVFEGRTFREIANMLGESVNTVMSRYRYALERMQGFLDKV